MEKLDSTKVNYIFLLSDGYHNRGISKDRLNSLFKLWPQNSRHYDAEAYFVLLSPKYRTSEIATIFDETDRMSIVETMNICRQTFDVEQTEQQSDKTIPAVLDSTDKSCSLLWLWILIAIGLCLLTIIVVFRLVPAIIQAPRLGIPWYKLFLQPNIRLIEDLNKIVKSKYNPENKTIGQLAKEYGFDPNKIKKRFTGEPDFSAASIGTFKVPKGTMNDKRDCHKFVWEQFARKNGVSAEEFKEIWKHPDAKSRLGKRIGIDNLTLVSR